jgi:peptide/nickel transport system permease protein
MSFLRRIFTRKEKDLLSEELVQSPGRTAIKNFLRRKLSIVGMVLFFGIVAFVFIASWLLPTDFRQMDSSQINVRPGLIMLNLPTALSNNARDITFGSRFGMGVCNDGRLYMWGDLHEGLRYGHGWRPSRTSPHNHIFYGMGRLVSVSAGLEHAVAINEEGRVFAWGSGMHLATLDVPTHLHARNLVDVRAGSWVTVAMCDEGDLHVWGNDAQFWSPNRYAPVREGNVISFDIGTFSAIVLTDEGMVYTPVQGGGAVVGDIGDEEPVDYDGALFAAHNPGEVPPMVQGNAIDVAMTDRVYAALLYDGRVVTWSLSPFRIARDQESMLPLDHPIQGRVTQIESGRWHFTALLDDGSVYSWGFNHLNQTNFPANTSGNVEIFTGYFMNAAVDGDGNVITWGHRGYLFGSDGLGRDVFRRTMHGGRITFTIGFVSVIVAVFIGLTLGGIAGYFGKLPDMIVMRLAEVFESIPFLPIVMLLAAIVPLHFPDITEMQRIMMIMVILGVITWPGFCRLTRAQILSEREREFVTAARALGIGNSRIIFRHIMPNVLSVVLVQITLSLSSALLIESTLSFLGFGVIAPTPTWGNMLDAARDFGTVVNLWWRWLFPALLLGASTISINVMGDGLRDALDPRMQEGR